MDNKLFMRVDEVAKVLDVSVPYVGSEQDEAIASTFEDVIRFISKSSNRELFTNLTEPTDALMQEYLFSKWDAYLIAIALSSFRQQFTHLVACIPSTSCAREFRSSSPSPCLER